MKRLLIIGAIAMLIFTACGSSSEPAKDYDLTSKDGLQAFCTETLGSSMATIDSVTINDDAGTGSGYIVLINATFKVENKADTAKSAIKALSDEMAGALASAEDVHELAIFWTVPYLDGDAKVSYSKNGSDFVVSDEVYSF